MRTLVAAALTGLVAGCAPSSADGTLRDGITGQPIAGATLHATQPDPTCHPADVVTDPAGAFRFESLCPGPTTLTLEEPLWLAATDTIPDGGAAAITLEAWRAPIASGIYRLSADILEPLRGSAELKSESIKGSTEQASYPARIPNDIGRIGPGDHLVLVGAELVDNTRIDPLIPSGPRTFGDADTNARMAPWSYIGVQFTDDTTFERITATIDASQVLDREKGDRKVRYIPGSAVPPGRYALHRPEGITVTVLDFGPPPSEPSAEPAAP